jgi:hypothetical protein
MAQETRDRRLEAERLQRRPEPDEVELEAWQRDRTYVALAALVNSLAGFVAVSAPWLANFSAGDRRWPPLAAGGVIVAAAGGRLFAPGLTRTLWTAVPILTGAFLLLAAFAFTRSSGAALADTVCGLGALTIALLTADAADLL